MLSLSFNNVYISDFDAIVGPNEKKGNIKKIKRYIKDFYYGEKTFELCQIKMENEIIDNLLSKCCNDIDLIIGGDLTNQICSTTYATNKVNISLIGIYSACSSFIEGLIIGSNLISSGAANKIVNVTSSHNLAAERQFRYPVEYGALRNPNSTFTATCAIGSILTSKKSNIKIKEATIGYPIEYGIKDANYIGAVMAPSAALVIKNHLDNFKHKASYYDVILTGDLGEVGVNILKEYLNKEYDINASNIIDAGQNLYKNICEINDGASGPTVLPLYFFYNVLLNKKYKKILLVGTGALHSRSLVNQKQPIPGISHAIGIEVIR